MNINIVCIGKLKEKYWVAGIEEYSKRLKAYCKMNIIELKEVRLPDKASLSEVESLKEAEGNEILKVIKEDSYVITLEVQGKLLSSEELAHKIEKLSIEGKSHITFVIGGSLGLGKNVLSHSDFGLSFSKMTFPHQMIRVVLLEQIYRSFKIIKKETYHK